MPTKKEMVSMLARKCIPDFILRAKELNLEDVENGDRETFSEDKMHMIFKKGIEAFIEDALR